jgi:predicted RNA-binding Zn-ribbon protein involved in translation (DUF1610 family)
MICPKCGVNNSTIINETTTKGKDFSGGKGCLGGVLFGPLGILCGACGKGKQMKNKQFFVCNNCGHKWEVQEPKK